MQAVTYTAMARNSTCIISMYSHDTYVSRTHPSDYGHRIPSAGTSHQYPDTDGFPHCRSFHLSGPNGFCQIPWNDQKTNDEYLPLSIKIHARHVPDIRENIITVTYKAFQPHLFIVDKEPLGLKSNYCLR